MTTFVLSSPRITGEPLFGHPVGGMIYPDDQIVYGSGNEHSPSVLPSGAVAGGFNFRPHSADLTSFLSAAVGNHHLLQGGLDIHPHDSDDEDDNEISAESDDGEDDDERSDGDESSAGELDE